MDLPGRRFNGYDLINDLKNHDIKQLVLEKYSNSDSVHNLFNNCKEYFLYLKLLEIEKKYSLQSIFSITSPLLIHSPQYKESDKIHIHSVANYKMSLYSLITINEEKDLILSLHDPWFLTGRCVHFFECDKWKNGCKKCPNLNTHYELKEDNCNMLWNLKKNIFKVINPKIIIASDWMKDVIDASPIIKNKKSIEIIPFGIDINKFKKRNISKSKYNIKEDEIVIFFRAQNNYKGTEFIIEALEKIENKENITIVTCGQKGIINNLKQDYKVIELGFIDEDTLIDIYSISDIFLMPSTGETFGLMAVEAMSCECPIIVFKDTALEQIVDAPNCGLCAKYKDSYSLYEKIIYLIDNKKAREKRGKLGRKLVKDKYMISSYLEKIDKIYNTNSKNKIESNIKSSNDNNLLYFLNTITEDIFKGNEKIIKKLKYDCIKDESKIDFSDLSVQKKIYEYCDNLYLLTLNEKFKIPVTIKIKYWIKKHRKIYNIIKNIIRK